jgi:hypothetical protein
MLTSYLASRGKSDDAEEGSGVRSVLALHRFKRHLRLQGDSGAVWRKALTRWKKPRLLASIVGSIPHTDTAASAVQFVLGRMSNLKDQGYYLWYAVQNIRPPTADQKMVARAARPAEMEIMLDPEGGWNIEMNDVFVYMALDAMMRTLDVTAKNHFPIRMVLSRDVRNAWLACDKGVFVIEQVSDFLARGVLPGNVLLFSRSDAGYYSNVTARELCQILAYDQGSVMAYYSRAHPHLLFFRHSRSMSQVDPSAFVQLEIAPNRKAITIPRQWIRQISASDALDEDRERCGASEEEAADAFVEVGSLPKFSMQSCTLRNVMEDMQWYSVHPLPSKEHQHQHHKGSLVEHSRWTADLVRDWFDRRDARTLGADPALKDLAVLCALLHDIGKAGDGDRSVMYKPEHPKTAMEYATGRRPYVRMVGLGSRPHDDDATYYAFLANSCQGLTPAVLAVVAVVGACHYDLGNVIRGKATSCGWVRSFLGACSEIVDGANDAIIKRLSKASVLQLARIVLCVSMVDVIGSWPAESSSSGSGRDRESDPAAPWTRFGYDRQWATVCGRIMRKLASALGLPRSSELVTGPHVRCSDQRDP